MWPRTCSYLLGSRERRHDYHEPRMGRNECHDEQTSRQQRRKHRGDIYLSILAVRTYIDVDEECTVTGIALCHGRQDAEHTATSTLTRVLQV